MKGRRVRWGRRLMGEGLVQKKKMLEKVIGNFISLFKIHVHMYNIYIYTIS